MPRTMLDTKAGLPKILWPLLGVALAVAVACEAKSEAHANSRAAPRPSVVASAASPFVPLRIERKDAAMGTSLHFIAYTSARADGPRSEAAIDAAIA
jgi:hypothetical protein